MSTTVEIPLDIAQLTGPLFLGHLFNWGLFGALSVQVYLYYLAFPKDKKMPKAIVACVYSLEVLQTCMSTVDSFRDFGTGWGNVAELDNVGLLWFSVPVLGSIICCMGQLFYAWRIWILSCQPMITIVIVLIALVQLGFGTFAGAHAHTIGVFSALQSHTFRTTSVWLGSAALNDIIISTCMIYYLHRSNTGFRHTSALLAKFIRLTIETGAICATFAILDLAFYVAFQNNNYHLAPSIPLSKLYSNSLLVVLNARVRIVGGRDNNDADSASLSYFNAVFPESTGRHQSRTQPSRKAHIRSGGISVAITHETQSDHLHIPMDEREEQSDIQKFDANPLDIPPEELDTINKNAQLV